MLFTTLATSLRMTSKVKPAGTAIVLAALGLILVLPGVGQASLTVGEKIGPGMEDRVDRPGYDYDRFHINDRRPDRCQSECARNPSRCKAWTYVRPGIQHKYAVCYLKSAVPAPQPNNCCISGVAASNSGGGGAAALPGEPARCKQGFVWRVARPTDYVCVVPGSRALVAQENSVATTRWDPNGHYGPYTCIAGFVWREAFDGDVVCVTPERRAEVKEENRLAPQRREWTPTRPY